MTESGIEEKAVAMEDPAPPAMTRDDEPRPFGVGDRLRQAREGKGMSLADVSQAIKIAPRVLEQIEANAWSELSGHTFARGVVRSYARLLQMDAEALLRELESAPLPKPPQLELPKSTQAAIPVPGEAQKRDRVAMLGGVLMVALAIVAYFLIPDDWFSRSGSQDARASAASPQTAAPQPVSAPVQISVAPPEPVSPSPGPAMPANPAPGPVPVEPVAAQGTGSVVPPQGLVLHFAQESWAEIRDRKGAILISENVAAGSERKLGGEPPYNIWLGNADGVRMSFRGQTVDLAPHTRQKVARLTLE